MGLYRPIKSSRKELDPHDFSPDYEPLWVYV
jgi:hypothetical protein